jgi:HSP20 family molecular chaperone IbpA
LLPVDLDVLPDRIVITTHLAGFTADEVVVQATGTEVTITTSREPGESTPEQRVTHEVYLGNWYRRIRLPKEVLPGQSTVTFQNGVLTIDLPRASVRQRIPLNLPGAESLERPEIPLRSSADVMPPGPGPHLNVYKP